MRKSAEERALEILEEFAEWSTTVDYESDHVSPTGYRDLEHSPGAAWLKEHARENFYDNGDGLFQADLEWQAERRKINARSVKRYKDTEKGRAAVARATAAQTARRRAARKEAA